MKKSNVGYLAYGEGMKDGKTVHVAAHCKLKTEGGAKSRILKMAEAYDGIKLEWAKAFECGIIEADIWDAHFRKLSNAEGFVTYWGDMSQAFRTATF
jgi:hypothetical protein